MDIKQLNTLIEQEFELMPVSYSQPTEIDADMRQCLAEAWAKEGFRKYMNNAVNKLILSTATKSTTMEDMMSRKGGILFLKQLMMVCESCFHDYNKIKKILK